MTVRPVRLGLLRMDDLPEHALHVRGGYPELYSYMFRDLPVTLTDIAVHRGATPASLDECDGWLLTGSRVSVYDDVGWIGTAAEIVRRAVAEERPLVGICFGHQLIAHALGGTVAKAAGGWGLGAQDYETVHALSWFPDADERMTLIASHQDQVVRAPDDAVVWSRADYCPTAGMVVGERAWSMQGHPEFTADVAHALYEGRRARLDPTIVDAAQSSLARALSNRAVAAAIVRFTAP